MQRGKENGRRRGTGELRKVRQCGRLGKQRGVETRRGKRGDWGRSRSVIEGAERGTGRERRQIRLGKE